MSAHLSKNPARLTLLLTLGMAATVLTALGFEHIGGFIPCALCLEQRFPYYIASPVCLLAAILLFQNPASKPAFFLVLATTGLMLWSLGLGIFHSGVEWAWWEGPAECAGGSNATTTSARDLLSQLQNTHAPSCTEAAGRFLGLSFAGWNVIASTLWLALCFKTIRTMHKPA